MLFIGDIHITSKHASALLGLIDELIDAHPEEQHIVFLGDYVYHFTYDRKALLQLFSKWIQLVAAGKHIYVLVGNHDRIADHFVFAEAEQTLKHLSSNKQLHFITEPTFFRIEETDCLFFPYRFPHTETFAEDRFPALHTPTHPQLMLARRANNILAELIGGWKETHKNNEKLLLIHHRYIANSKFPGQKATFTYQSPALDPSFFQDPQIWSISGHLHETFVADRYLCTGSIWHTSPLEVNQQKYCFLLDTQARQLTALPLRYNPYIGISDPIGPITSDTVQTERQSTIERINKQLTGGQRSVNILPQAPQPLTYATLIVTTSQGAMQDVQQLVEPELSSTGMRLQHKLLSRANELLLSDLDTAGLNLTERFSDRKTLLLRFLAQKYPAKAPAYEQLLRELQIL